MGIASNPLCSLRRPKSAQLSTISPHDIPLEHHRYRPNVYHLNHSQDVALYTQSQYVPQQLVDSYTDENGKKWLCPAEGRHLPFCGIVGTSCAVGFHCPCGKLLSPCPQRAFFIFLRFAGSFLRATLKLSFGVLCVSKHCTRRL